jgi:hypothetical protein
MLHASICCSAGLQPGTCRPPDQVGTGSGRRSNAFSNRNTSRVLIVDTSAAHPLAATKPLGASGAGAGRAQLSSSRVARFCGCSAGVPTRDSSLFPYLDLEDATSKTRVGTTRFIFTRVRTPALQRVTGGLALPVSTVGFEWEQVRPYIREQEETDGTGGQF